MVEDSGMKLLLTESILPAQFSPYQALRVVRLEGLWPQLGKESSSVPTYNIEPDQAVYILYTSGSTGESNASRFPTALSSISFCRWQKRPDLEAKIGAVPGILACFEN